MDSMNLAPYIDNERLADYAVSCARLLKSTGTQSGAEAALRLHESIRELRRCRDTLHRRYTGAPAVPSGCEWLLDNWYMVQREGPAAEDELRHARSLRRCRDGLIITELCRTLLQAGHGSSAAVSFSKLSRASRCCAGANCIFSLLPCAPR